MRKRLDETSLHAENFEGKHGKHCTELSARLCGSAHPQPSASCAKHTRADTLAHARARTFRHAHTHSHTHARTRSLARTSTQLIWQTLTCVDVISKQATQDDKASQGQTSQSGQEPIYQSWQR
eukprot:3674495-Pleurochrysis_carterae.AAC.1